MDTSAPNSTYEDAPIVEYEVRWISLDLQNFINFFCVLYGWISTWRTAGLISQEHNKSLIKATLKFDIPMFLTSPSFTNYSMALHVSRIGTGS